MIVIENIVLNGLALSIVLPIGNFISNIRTHAMENIRSTRKRTIS